MLSRETQGFMEAAVDAVIVISHLGAIQAVNDSARRMFGYRNDELLGENVSMLMPGPDRENHDRYIAGHLQSGLTKVIGLGRRVAARRKDGTLFPAHLSVGRIPDANPARFVGLVRDDTDLVRRESDTLLAHDRLTRVARLATMGEMAAGIAHELNQPLTAITTYARACEHFMNMPQPDLPELREAVREINAEGLRAGRIIARLRELVRSDEHGERIPTDINTIIEELKILLTADARIYDTRLSLALAPNLPRVSANPIQLQQMVLSLVRNAFEALVDTPPSERAIDLTTIRTVTGDIEIQVSDNGPGVAAAIQDRLFDPFVTTKKAGTGLGLAISRTIAQSHGGTIGTRPVTPHGASFYVNLPGMEDDRS